jgi:hypothetical protein
VRVKGVPSCPNSVLHPWLKQELTAILNSLPAPTAAVDLVALRALWDSWFAGLAAPPTMPDPLPPVRLLLVLDNLRGHKSPEFVAWPFQHGVIPLYTPLDGNIRRDRKKSSSGWKRRDVAGTASPPLLSGAGNGQNAGPAVVNDSTPWAALAPVRIGRSADAKRS